MITKKAKRELCYKIIDLNYKKNNKVLNLYELLKNNDIDLIKKLEVLK